MWVLIVLIIVLAVLGLLGAYSLWVEPNWLRIRRRVILVDGWDPALDGLKILHLSDLHAGSAPSRIERFVRRAAEVPADFAVITGDFLSGPRGADDCARILSQLTARTEVYAVLGNHEHRHSSFHWPPIRTLRVTSMAPSRQCPDCENPGEVRHQDAGEQLHHDDPREG